MQTNHSSLFSYLIYLFSANRLLMVFGLLNLVAAVLLLIYLPYNTAVVLGINSMIKPLKFAVSQWLFSWTIAWMMTYLDQQQWVRRYSRFACLVLTYELVVITVQAYRGRLSHFNQSLILDVVLYALMGLAIVLLMLYTLYIAVLFFRQKRFMLSANMVWSIRLSLLLFFIFSMEGGLMAQHAAHTVGAADGGSGLPLSNWSRQHGDLRIAHFLGIHALQIIPLAAYLFSRLPIAVRKQTASTIGFTLLYAIETSFLFIQAMRGLPVISTL